MAIPAIHLQPSDARLSFDRFELDEADARLTCAGRAVQLPPKPFAVLCALARSPQVLVPKNALLDAVWGHRFVSDAVLRTAMSDLRSALGENARRPRIIETVSRSGYRFIGAAVSSSTQSPSAGERKGAGANEVEQPRPAPPNGALGVAMRRSLRLSRW